jgi:hypothetical protein
VQRRLEAHVEERARNLVTLDQVRADLLFESG